MIHCILVTSSSHCFAFNIGFVLRCLIFSHLLLIQWASPWMTHIRSDLACICSLCSYWPSFSPLATASASLSFALWHLYCRRRRPPFPTTQQRRPSPRRFPGITKPPTRSSNQVCLVSLCSLIDIKPLHSHPHDPPLSDSYPLFRSNVSPLTTSLTGKQLRNRPLQDFSTDLLEMPCKQLGKKVTSRPRPSLMLDGRRPLPILTTSSWIDFCRPPSLFSYYPSVVLDTPARLSLTAYIFFMEASIYEVSEKIVPL